jgi:hypothetical protein
MTLKVKEFDEYGSVPSIEMSVDHARLLLEKSNSPEFIDNTTGKERDFLIKVAYVILEDYVKQLSKLLKDTPYITSDTEEVIEINDRLYSFRSESKEVFEWTKVPKEILKNINNAYIERINSSYLNKVLREGGLYSLSPELASRKDEFVCRSIENNYKEVKK